LTVWYALVLAAGLSLFSALIWLSLRNRLMDEIDQDLAARAGQFERYFSSQSSHAAPGQLYDELESSARHYRHPSYVERCVVLRFYVPVSQERRGRVQRSNAAPSV
jgi:hypothetical protein